MKYYMHYILLGVIYLLTTFPSLVNCEWSITAPANNNYNCIAWTINNTSWWVNMTGITGPAADGRYLISIDRTYGNNDGTMTEAELDAFYDANGFEVTNATSAEIMYYSEYHGAKKKTCSCGAGQWDMWESKLGAEERIEHLRNQINGTNYGTPVRYYKAK